MFFDFAQICAFTSFWMEDVKVQIIACAQCKEAETTEATAEVVKGKW